MDAAISASRKRESGKFDFGGISKERIHFNEKTLWTGGPSSSRPNYQFGNKATAYTATEIENYRKLLDDKSSNVFNDDQSLGGYGMGAKIRFPGEDNLNKGSYQDFGDIWLDFPQWESLTIMCRIIGEN